VNNFPPLTHIELLYVNLESTNLSAPKNIVQKEVNAL